MNKKTITLKDVASAAGVALATASQVLRGSKHSWASEATKKRIWEAARTLGYRPNPAARLLASRQGHYFAIVTNRLNDPTLEDAVQGVVDRVMDAGYIPFVVEARRMQWELYDNIESLADAVMFIGGGGKEFVKRIDQFGSGVATVVATAPLGSRFPEFVWDEEEGFACILDYLERLGHRKVGLLGGGETDGNSHRVQAFADACAQKGREHRVVYSNDEKNPIQVGRQMMARLLENHPEITAVVGRNVEFSVGALAEAQRQGIRVPEDLSIVSYADSRIASGVWPSLTALQTPVEEAVARAVDAALDMLKGRSVERGPTILKNTQLVVRASAGLLRRV